MNIEQKVKEIVHRYDENAQVILFGSRARGDWNEESDWDFLILTDKNDTEDLFKKIRNDVILEVELPSLNVVQTIIRNRRIWEEDYWITPLYNNVKEEGILI